MTTKRKQLKVEDTHTQETNGKRILIVFDRHIGIGINWPFHVEIVEWHTYEYEWSIRLLLIK